MKTNGTRRIVTFMLALVLVFTTVCVGTTEVEAAEKFTTIIAPTQTEQATAGTEVKDTVFSDQKLWICCTDRDRSTCRYDNYGIRQCGK